MHRLLFRFPITAPHLKCAPPPPPDPFLSVVLKKEEKFATGASVFTVSEAGAGLFYPLGMKKLIRPIMLFPKLPLPISRFCFASGQVLSLFHGEVHFLGSGFFDSTNVRLGSGFFIIGGTGFGTP